MFKVVTLGADPEAFVLNTVTNEIVSAEGMIGGTKYEPKVISDQGHAIQEDNVMVEFNIPPCSDEQEFIDNINYSKDFLNTMLNFTNHRLEIIPSATLYDNYLNTEQARMFGCDPDMNVYLKDFNDSPCSNTNLRTCGGHIHVGFKNANKVKWSHKEELIYAMDITLGLDSLQLDNDDRRREMYGNAGSFRVKPYGIEYRTLSNFWIKSDELISWAFQKTMDAIELVENRQIVNLIKNYSDNVRKAIDTNDKELALQIQKKLKKEKILI